MNGQKVELTSPFAILPTTPLESHAVEYTPGFFRTLVHKQGFTLGRQIQSPETSEIPRERIEGGAPIVYSASVTPSGRIFCALSGTRQEGEHVIELDASGGLKARFLLRLRIFTHNDKHGEMSPRLLRVSDTKIALASWTANKIAVFRLPK